MGELWAVYRSYGMGPKPEIVKGNAQIYMTRSRSSNSPIPTRRNKVRKSSSFKSWSFNDPEMKRWKRVAKYKAYSVEGKFKSSFRKGYRWLKNKCSLMVHGF
ncbi:hypothetical protein HHK36_012321 [Tetracentron sinense]|uniref:Uncharacterized protein n=1 Tax=Tetracentron sinense TaxID=13715 RepID=A0A835DFF0_TETSI|nr:hypothetical protein HHK36_012305 [Tetracentron sinense]KAF8401383.1 hypothetical protein HHK36_012321 [Tetracentron sinense]